MGKNILIISNGAVNNTDSNGRTVARLFDNILKENKSQFFTYGTPDFSICENYYKVSDSDVLSAIKGKKINGDIVKSEEEKASSVSSEKPGISKTPLVMLLREVCWKIAHWKNKNLKEWIDNKVNPSCVFLYLGDNWFTIDFAIWVAKRKKIPIVVYSTEEYSFKNYNYVTRKKSMFYNIWFNKLRRKYKKLNKYTKIGLFNSEELTNIYANEYKYKCLTLYQSSDIDWKKNSKLNKTVSYLGNLGLNRQKALIEVANALKEIDKDIHLDIYGKATDEIKEELSLCDNIRLQGFVSYDEVVNIIHKSCLLIHAEYSDEFYNRDLKYAFSTKITDSVCSGTPLFIYAPEELSGTKFVIKENCAFYATNSAQLKEKLEIALKDEKQREIVLDNAYKTRQNYFINNGILAKILEEVLDESNAN